jgi:hypothetical protein
MARYFHSGMTGAPQNTNAVGAMCGILDDCLVNGFNVKSPLTVTVSAGVATLVYATAHGYSTDIDLRIADASVAAVNGDRRCTVLDAQTLTVPTPGAPDGAVGGTVITRVAPLGWQIAFTDTNVRVYRSPNVEGTRFFYRLQDTATASFSPSVRGYESMSDANTGTDPFPTTGQQGGAGLPFYKSNSATARDWVVVGDDRTVYVALTDSTSSALYPFVMGDMVSHKDGDAYAAMLTPVNGSAVDRLAMSASTTSYLARSYDQVTKSVVADTRSPVGGNSGGGGAYPSLVSGGVTLVGPVHVTEGGALRGSLRGLLHTWEAISAWPFTVLTGVAGVDGRVLVTTCGISGRVAYTLDEPW